MKLNRRLSDIRFKLRNIIFRGHNNVRLRKFSNRDWVETDDRLVEATFELLREFVEEQQAWMECMSDKYSWFVRFRLRYTPNRFREQLSRELGLKHLDWAISLGSESPRQADGAKKIKELYLWYMDEYNTYDPWSDVPEPPGELFQFTPYHPEAGEFRELIIPEGPDWDVYNSATKYASTETDRLYEEATQKAMEVIQIRANLWT